MVDEALEFASELNLGDRIWNSWCWRGRGDEMNKPGMDSMPTVDYLIDIWIWYTAEDSLRGLIR